MHLNTTHGGKGSLFLANSSRNHYVRITEILPAHTLISADFAWNTQLPRLFITTCRPDLLNVDARCSFTWSWHSSLQRDRVTHQPTGLKREEAVLIFLDADLSFIINLHTARESTVFLRYTEKRSAIFFMIMLLLHDQRTEFKPAVRHASVTLRRANRNSAQREIRYSNTSIVGQSLVWLAELFRTLSNQKQIKNSFQAIEASLYKLRFRIVPLFSLHVFSWPGTTKCQIPSHRS